MKLNIKAIVLIILFSASSALVFNYFNPDGITIIKTEKKTETPAGNGKVEFVKPISITADDARLIFTKDVRFIDVRSSEDFRNGHIPNAINLPNRFLKDVKSVLKDFQSDTPFVIYGSNSAEGELNLSSVQIFGNGYRKLYIFPGGFEEWTAKKFPVVK